LEKFEGLVKRLVKSFNEAEIDYMFTGALAASYYGTPRTTMDIDIVVKISRKELQTLAAVLKKTEIHVNEAKIKKAFESGYRIITLKDKKTPFTVDIILSDKKLEKKAGTILGLPTFYQTPEGLILSKLRMIKATVPKERAIKDMEDIKAILKYTKVNMRVLKRRARKEKILTMLEELT
jgi:hypothetical protein